MSGSIPRAPTGTGMISPATPFVAPDLALMPLGFRFLMELWADVGALQQQAASLQTQINTINTRLAAAGIP